MRAEAAQDLTNSAAQVTGSFFLTGEKASFKRVKPKKSFDAEKGQWGAFEVVGRAQTLQLDEDAFPTFADPARSTSSALGIGGGINWYLNSNVRFGVNYERTTFEAAADGAQLPAENLLLTRFQVSF